MNTRETHSNLLKITKTLLLTTALVASPQAFAQKVETRGDASVVTYEKEFFETYNAVTLLDMLQIIPGVKEILDENDQGGNSQQERGFGSGGDQILMNGKRLAGKSNNINDTLARISASQIASIELIRGTTSGLDVQSQGLVINVNTLGDASTSSTFWQVGSRYTIGKIFQPRFLVSHTGSSGNLDYTFSVERDDGGFFFTRDEQIFDGAGTQTATQLDNGNLRFLSHRFNTNLGYTFNDGSELRLNGQYEPGSFYGTQTRDRNTNPERPLFWDIDNDFDDWEVGGDFTTDINTLGKLKALFVINQRKENGHVDRFRGPSGGRYDYYRETSSANDKEKILRASLTNSLTSNQQLEFGGEAAINTSNRTFLSRDRSTADDTFAISNDDMVDIKENRYEIFAHHTYNVSSKFVIQTSLTTEFSKIIADNIFADGSTDQRDTSFTYLKPRLNLRYDFTQRDQLRATVEKKVSQLDFDNFVTEFDRSSNVFNFGNTNIRPEQVWEFSASYEHRLPNDGGSIEVELFYHNYTDHIAKVDFTDYIDFDGNTITADEFFSLPPTEALINQINAGNGFNSKSGNIGSANAYGVKLQGSLRFGFVGVPDAVLSATYTYEKRDVEDDFLHDSRSFDRHSDHQLTFNFRHDVRSINLTYGLEATVNSDFNIYDVNFRWPQKPAAEFLAFLEYTFTRDYKLRVEFENITGVRNRSTFLFYNNHIRFDDLASRTERHMTNPREITVSLQGTF